MITPILNYRGNGCLIVKHADNTEDSYPNHNDILDNFFAWVASKQYVGNLSVAGKVGTGSSDTDLGMTALESIVTLKSGNWPLHTNNTGNFAQVINGTTLTATIDFVLTFAVGQIEDNISEYGIDLTYNKSPTSDLVHTRVKVTDDQGNPATIPVKLTDQLIIKYNIELSASLDVPSYQIAVDRGNGVTNLHTIKYYWGQALRFADYFTHKGWSGDNIPVQVANVAIPAPNMSQQSAAWINGPMVVPVYQSDRIVIPLDFTTVQGNVAGGITTLATGNGQGWWRFQISPPLMKTEAETLSLVIERPFRGELLAPPVPVAGSVVDASTVGGYPWYAMNGTLTGEYTNAGQALSWATEEVIATIGLYSTDGTGAASVGNMRGIAIHEGEMPLIAIAVGQRKGLVSGEQFLDQYDAYLELKLGTDTKKFKLFVNSSVSGETLWATYNNDGALVTPMVTDGYRYETNRFKTGVINESTAVQLIPGDGPSLNFAGTWEEIWGQYIGGTLDCKLTVTPKDFTKDSILAHLQLVITEGDSIEGGGGGNIVSDSTLGGFNWLQGTSLSDGEVAPDARTRVWDNGEFQVAIGGYNSSGVDSEIVNDTFTVEIGAGEYPTVLVGVGQYAAIGAGESYLDDYKVFLEITAKGQTVKYMMIDGMEAMGYYRETTPGNYDMNNMLYSASTNSYNNASFEGRVEVYYVDDAFEAAFGEPFDLIGSRNVGGEFNIVVRAVPNDPNKSPILATAQIIVKAAAGTGGGDTGGGDTGTPAEGEGTEGAGGYANTSAIGGWNWDLDSNISSDDTSPDSQSLVWDNGEFQVVMGAYPADGLAPLHAEDATLVRVSSEDYVNFVFGAGQYGSLPSGERFTDHYDVYMQWTAGEVTKKYKILTVDDNVGWYGETTPGVYARSIGDNGSDTNPERWNSSQQLNAFAALYWPEDIMYSELDSPYTVIGSYEVGGDTTVIIRAIPRDESKATIVATRHITVVEDTSSGGEGEGEGEGATTWNYTGIFGTFHSSSNVKVEDARMIVSEDVNHMAFTGLAVTDENGNYSYDYYNSGSDVMVTIPSGTYDWELALAYQDTSGTNLSDVSMYVTIRDVNSGNAKNYKLAWQAAQAGYLLVGESEPNSGEYDDVWYDPDSYSLGDNKAILFNLPSSIVNSIVGPFDEYNGKPMAPCAIELQLAVYDSNDEEILAISTKYVMEGNTGGGDGGTGGGGSTSGWAYSSESGSVHDNSSVPYEYVNEDSSPDGKHTAVMGVGVKDEDWNIYSNYNDNGNGYDIEVPTGTYDWEAVFGYQNQTDAGPKGYTALLTIRDYYTYRSKNFKVVWQPAQAGYYLVGESVANSGTFDTVWYDPDGYTLGDDRGYIFTLTSSQISGLLGPFEEHNGKPMVPCAINLDFIVKDSSNATVFSMARAYGLTAGGAPLDPNDVGPWTYGDDNNGHVSTAEQMTNYEGDDDALLLMTQTYNRDGNYNKSFNYYDADDEAWYCNIPDDGESVLVLGLGMAKRGVELNDDYTFTITLGIDNIDRKFQIQWLAAQAYWYLVEESAPNSGVYNKPWYDPNFSVYGDGSAWYISIDAQTYSDRIGELATYNGYNQLGRMVIEMVATSKKGLPEEKLATEVYIDPPAVGPM